MPTVADLQRRSPNSLRVFIERQGLRGGPFHEVFDPEGLLVLPLGTLAHLAEGRLLARAQQPAGRLILRRGAVDDRFLRSWICSDDATSGAESIDLVLEDADGELRARWLLDDVRVLEVADRRRRSAGEPRFEYVLIEGRLVGISGGAPVDV